MVNLTILVNFRLKNCHFWASLSVLGSILWIFGWKVSDPRKHLLSLINFLTVYKYMIIHNFLVHISAHMLYTVYYNYILSLRWSSSLCGHFLHPNVDILWRISRENLILNKWKMHIVVQLNNWTKISIASFLSIFIIFIFSFFVIQYCSLCKFLSLYFDAIYYNKAPL